MRFGSYKHSKVRFPPIGDVTRLELAMSLNEDLSTLIKRIYCAGEDANEWDRVADAVLGYVGADGGCEGGLACGRCRLGFSRFW